MGWVTVEKETEKYVSKEDRLRLSDIKFPLLSADDARINLNSTEKLRLINRNEVEFNAIMGGVYETMGKDGYIWWMPHVHKNVKERLEKLGFVVKGRNDCAPCTCVIWDIDEYNVKYGDERNDSLQEKLDNLIKVLQSFK